MILLASGYSMKQARRLKDLRLSERFGNGEDDVVPIVGLMKHPLVDIATANSRVPGFYLETDVNRV